MPAIRLTVLGDSFVEGRGDPAVGGGYRGWVPTFAALLGLPAAAVRNLGTYQATTQHVVERQLPKALASKPPLIGVIAGVNDLVQDYEPTRFRRNLHTIFGSLAGMDTTVFTASYPDIPANLPVPDGFRRLLRGRFAEANDALADVCTVTGTLRLDIAAEPEWATKPMWSPDGLHPSAEGHRRFAESMAGHVTTLAIAA